MDAPSFRPLDAVETRARRPLRPGIERDALLTGSFVFLVAWGASALLVHRLAGRPGGLGLGLLAGPAAALGAWTFTTLRRSLARLQTGESPSRARDLGEVADTRHADDLEGRSSRPKKAG